MERRRTSVVKNSYKEQTDLTHLPAGFATSLPAYKLTPEQIVSITQNLLIHSDQLSLYDLSLKDFSDASRETLPLQIKLSEVTDLERRLPEKRLLATCRDYALLTCSLFRHYEIPARVRCGFADYFISGQYEDHWICEYWDKQEDKWVKADSQLDEHHLGALDIDFEITNIPTGRFVTANQAWFLYQEETDPFRFGQGEHRGEWFLVVNLCRDLLSLCHQEISDWDGWRDASLEARAGVLMTDWNIFAEQIKREPPLKRLLELKNNHSDLLTPFWK